MLCFQDKTFCGSKVHKPECKRQMTDELRKEAEKSPFPVAWANFCDEVIEENAPPEFEKFLNDNLFDLLA